MWLLIGVAAALALYWLHDRVTRGRHPPEMPNFYPVVGAIPELMGISYDKIWNLMKMVLDSTVQIGGFGRIWIGYQTIFTVTERNAGAQILTECLEKDHFYKFFRPWLGQSLILGDVPIWQSHRKLIAPAFKQCILDGFFDAFNQQTRHLIKGFNSEVGKGPVDIFHHLALLTLRTFAISLCGLNEEILDKLDNTIKEYLFALDLYQIVCIKRLTKIWFHVDWVFDHMGGELKVDHDRLLKILHKISNEIIESKRKLNKGNPPTDDTSKPFLELSLKLAEDKDFTEEELRSEVDLMLFAGHDTTATALMFTLIMLGSYPEVQEKLFKEIEQVLPDPNKDVSKFDLTRLVYMEAVLKETMRLYPPVPVLGRNLHKDMRFESCTLRAGNKCGVAVYWLHRDPAAWGPDAAQFRPERWLAGAPVCPGAYMPFSWGRRGCIGKAYAMMSMKTALAHLARAYRFSADHTQMEFQFHLMLKPVSGHHVAIERR